MKTGDSILKDFAKALYVFQRIPIDGKTFFPED